MIKNYFKTAFRNITRNKATFFINALGLILGISCCLLIFMVITHELSYNTFHKNANAIFRVETDEIGPNGTNTYPGTFYALPAVLKSDVPEIKEVTQIDFQGGKIIAVPADNGDVTRFKEDVAFANGTLFKIFDYSWLTGNIATALSEPNSVLLTKKYAEKYFDVKNGLGRLIGKNILLENKTPLKVTGILKDYPDNSDFPFNIIVSFNTLKNLDPNFNPNNWDGYSDNAQTYILLTKNASLTSLESRFPAIVEKYKGPGQSKKIAYSLLPLTELHSNGNYSNRSLNKTSIYYLSVIGLFILIIACINYINLSTAQSVKRSKEAGIRKVLGSNRWQLIWQNMSESAVITFIAVIVSIGVTYLSIPHVSEFIGVQTVFSESLLPACALFVTILLLSVTFLAGFYPAFIISRFNPISALKNNVENKQNAGVSLRKVLVIFQFCISQVLIICTIVVAKQIHFFKNQDLGFNKESIITLPIPDNNSDKLKFLKNQLSNLSAMKGVSFSMNSASDESNFMTEFQYNNTTARKTEAIRTQFKSIDENFLDVYGIQLLAGRDVRAGDSLNVLVNEVFAKRMGFSTPSQAVGETIINGPQLLSVVGVVKDFHVNSLHQNIDPTLMAVTPAMFHQANIKVASSQGNASAVKKTIAAVEKIWTTTYPDQVFNYNFLDKALENAYKNENRTFSLINLFSAIAIIIGCLGLYALISYTVIQKQKEIGVRKVLGATAFNIMTLISKDFAKLILVALVIATPIAALVMRQWLQNFAFRIALEWWVLIIAGLSSIVIAFLTIGFQAIKAALANPVKSLRTE